MYQLQFTNKNPDEFEKEDLTWVKKFKTKINQKNHQWEEKLY